LQIQNYKISKLHITLKFSGMILEAGPPLFFLMITHRR